MKTEKEEEKHSNFRLIWSFLKGSKALFAVCIISAALMALADMVIPQIIRAAIDNAIGGAPADYPAAVMRLVDRAGGFAYLGEHLWVMALAIVAVALVKAISQYLFRLTNSMAAETMVKTMRDGLFEHIEHLPFAWHMKNRTGDIIQRCTSDIDTMKNFISEQMTSILRIIILLVMAVIFMLGMNVRLTFIALIPVPVIIGYSLLYYKRVGDGFLDCDENEGKLSAMAQENLTGVRVVRAFGRERYERDRFEEQNEYYTSKWVRLAKVMSRYWSSSDVLSGTEVLLVVVFGAAFCLRGEMTSGEYVAFISYNSMLVWPVRMLGRMISEMSKAGVSVERIAYIMNSPVEQDKPGTTEPDLSGDIRFEHVSFAYEGCPEILHDIDFTMPAGSVLGILGGTGSGKSTLIDLVCRFYDATTGTVSLFGHNVKEYGFTQLRRMVGIVPQQAVLFTGTIRDNMRWAAPDATDEEIWQALEIAQAADFVHTKPGMLDAPVETAGRNFSGGQRQRLTIARALVPKPKVLILDDSASALDFATDAALRKAIKEKTEGMTVFIVSQRAASVQRADHILVLDDGVLTGDATHSQLLKTCEVYKEICLSQLSKEEVEKTL